MWEDPGSSVHFSALLEYLGIDKTRIITGYVHSEVLFLPRGQACYKPSLLNIQFLSLELRKDIEKEFSSQKSIVILKRTAHLRWIKNYPEFLSSVQKLARENNINVEIFSDQHMPSVNETAKLFNRAFMVIGLHGAGLSNLIFSRPGTVVFEIACYDMHRNLRLNYPNLMSVLGHRYYAFVPEKSTKQACLQVNVSKIIVAVRYFVEQWHLHQTWTVNWLVLRLGTEYPDIVKAQEYDFTLTCTQGTCIDHTEKLTSAFCVIVYQSVAVETAICAKILVPMKSVLFTCNFLCARWQMFLYFDDFLSLCTVTFYWQVGVLCVQFVYWAEVPGGTMQQSAANSLRTFQWPGQHLSSKPQCSFWGTLVGQINKQCEDCMGAKRPNKFPNSLSKHHGTKGEVFKVTFTFLWTGLQKKFILLRNNCTFSAKENNSNVGCETLFSVLQTRFHRIREQIEDDQWTRRRGSQSYQFHRWGQTQHSPPGPSALPRAPAL